MRQWLFVFLLVLGSSFTAAGPARASDRPVIFFDWGEAFAAPSNLTSFGIQIQLSNQEGLDSLYIDAGADYNEEAFFLSAGLILRPSSPQAFFRPYAGCGLTWHLAGQDPFWDIAPHMKLGLEVFWLYWEEEIRLYALDPEIVSRTGLRIRF